MEISWNFVSLKKWETCMLLFTELQNIVPINACPFVDNKLQTVIIGQLGEEHSLINKFLLNWILNIFVIISHFLFPEI